MTSTTTVTTAFRAVLTAGALSLAAMVALSVTPTPAQAQARETIEASPKGSIGLGLVGAEIGMVLAPAFGLDDAWAQILFPVAGAAGGAAAGYYLVDQSGSGEMGIAMMTTGMVLLIPALILTISLGRYDPESDDASTGQLLAHMSPRQRMRAQAGPGLLRISADRDVFLAPPAIEVAASERDGRSDTRVRVALLSGSF